MMSLRSLVVGAAALTAFSVAGCSDAVAPPSQAGVYVEINSAPLADTPPGRKCTILGYSAQIGNPPPSKSSPGKRVVDGEGGASVTCKVSKSGDVFKFQGKTTHKKVSFFASGEVTKGGAGTARVTEYDPESLRTMGNPTDTPCVVSVADPFEVANGRIYAEFHCPAFVDISQPDAELFCEAEVGWFVFENCDE